MSQELIVYTRLPEICTVERLAGHLHDVGWEVRVLDEYSRSAHVLQAGTLLQESVVYGWPRDSRKGARLAARFPTDRPIDAWALPEDALAGCNISASLLETPDDQFELDQWIGDQHISPEKLAVLQQAQCRYEVSNWVTDGPSSDRLLRDTAWALAKATGGIIFDPSALRAVWAEEMHVSRHEQRAGG
jgi:hypothetical protein